MTGFHFLIERAGGRICEEANLWNELGQECRLTIQEIEIVSRERGNNKFDSNAEVDFELEKA
jgi:hypothetical protein